MTRPCFEKMLVDIECGFSTSRRDSPKCSIMTEVVGYAGPAE